MRASSYGADIDVFVYVPEPGMINGCSGLLQRLDNDDNGGCIAGSQACECNYVSRTCVRYSAAGGAVVATSVESITSD